MFADWISLTVLEFCRLVKNAAILGAFTAEIAVVASIIAVWSPTFFFFSFGAFSISLIKTAVEPTVKARGTFLFIFAVSNGWSKYFPIAEIVDLTFLFPFGTFLIFLGG